MKYLHLANVWLYGVTQWRTSVVPLYSSSERAAFFKGRAVVPMLKQAVWRFF